MKKFKIILLSIFVLTFLNTCGTVKDAFSNQKKNNTDEFLVEKKSPLELPPDFEKLPLPGNKTDKKIKSGTIEELLANSENDSIDDQKSKSEDKTLEDQLLEKIKN